MKQLNNTSKVIDCTVIVLELISLVALFPFKVIKAIIDIIKTASK